MSTLKVSRKSQRGAAALEFALVVPVLILLVFGIVDFGNVMNAQSVVANAAREGARSAALGASSTQAKSVASGAIATLPGASNVGTNVAVVCKTALGATCSLDDATADSGGTVTVTITYVHSWLSPAILGLSNTLNIVQTSQMRIE